MDYIGIKELKSQAPRIMRAVREEGARYVVTYHGRPTAMILPLDEAEVEAEVARMIEQALTELDEDTELERELASLRKEIAAAWRSPLTAVEAIEDQRR
jgi:prevent-host-death family protein